MCVYVCVCVCMCVCVCVCSPENRKGVGSECESEEYAVGGLRSSVGS